jgi:hypothetical protein
MSVKVGLVTGARMSKPMAMPCVKAVLPAPNSPDNAITSPEIRCLPSSAPRAAVSSMLEVSVTHWHVSIAFDHYTVSYQAAKLQTPKGFLGLSTRQEGVMIGQAKEENRMRVLVLSDIHANFAALEAVIADATFGMIIRCLVSPGDLVGYGPEPNECVELVREMNP